MLNINILLTLILILVIVALGLYLKAEIQKIFTGNNSTIIDIEKRLALIDKAQQNLQQLSTNMLGLQDILSNRSARGAFGEVQLKNLLSNLLPRSGYKLQHTLSNGMRADCILLLPEPTGNIVIDSKFPLENFQRNNAAGCRIDIKKHIKDIASKYIISGETGNGAIMFIPAESIFATIHEDFVDLVEFAQQHNVWLTSPTTLMAIVTTASAVLQDTATKKHIHVIQEHLQALGQDFLRFNDRMQKLAKHVDMTKEDMNLVLTSSNKIVSRFNKIEKVDLDPS
ncbi:MAG: DNA recombination protein RmuC [Thiotrichales bacterium]|nr:MAG: DNA recombination protein RmuC [Thiotrichales bacterium]